MVRAVRALAVVFVLLAGCDLQPPPKKQAPTAQRPGTVTPPAAGGGSAAVKPSPAQPPKPPPTPPTPGSADAGSSSGSGSAAAESAPSCLEVGTAFAELWVRTSKDPSDKAANELDRTKLVKKITDGCTTAAWSEEVRTCYMKATDRTQADACGKLVRPAKARDNPAGN
jgi:hypothetical protein